MTDEVLFAHIWQKFLEYVVTFISDKCNNTRPILIVANLVN